MENKLIALVRYRGCDQPDNPVIMRDFARLLKSKIIAHELKSKGDGQQPLVIQINGDVGSGKSQLLREITRILKNRGYEIKHYTSRNPELTPGNQRTVHIVDEIEFDNVYGLAEKVLSPKRLDYFNGIVLTETVQEKVSEAFKGRELITIKVVSHRSVRAERVKDWDMNNLGYNPRLDAANRILSYDPGRYQSENYFVFINNNPGTHLEAFRILNEEFSEFAKEG